MSAAHFDQALPRLPLASAIALVAATLAMVTAVRLGAPTQPGASAVPAAVVSRDLKFVDRPGGDIDVVEAGTGKRIEVLHAGADGFVRATLRTLAHERLQRGIGPDRPFRLSVRANGGLMLEDPATGRQLELEAYGSTNAAKFVTLLVAKREQPH